MNTKNIIFEIDMNFREPLNRDYVSKLRKKEKCANSTNNVKLRLYFIIEFFLYHVRVENLNIHGHQKLNF